MLSIIPEHVGLSCPILLSNKSQLGTDISSFQADKDAINYRTQVDGAVTNMYLTIAEMLHQDQGMILGIH